MSTVDIDKGAENIAKLNKLGYPELDGACPTCGINPVTILAHHTQTLKAELLAKMPKERPDATKQGELIPFNGKNGVEMHWLRKCQDAGFNEAITEITKIVEEL